MEMSVNSV